MAVPASRPDLLTPVTATLPPPPPFRLVCFAAGCDSDSEPVVDSRFLG